MVNTIFTFLISALLSLFFIVVFSIIISEVYKGAKTYFKKKKLLILCPDHALKHLKVGQMALVDFKRCQVCSKKPWWNKKL